MLNTISSPQQIHERLLIELSGMPMSRFEVTDVVRDGPTLVLQCEPTEHEESAQFSLHPAKPASHFAVTEIVQDGTSLVLQCQPKKTEDEDTPGRRQDDATHVYYPNERREGLSRHDPGLLYEDLR